MNAITLTETTERFNITLDKRFFSAEQIKQIILWVKYAKRELVSTFLKI